jgi:HNH endonuclease
MSRPPIPRQLERDVLVEAGHRCAIPTCRQIPVEIAHIVPYSDVLGHTFDNLIALCPNCHRRYDNGQIDRKSMLHYNIEKSILMFFADRPNEREIRLSLSGNNDIFIMYLLRDGLLEFDRELVGNFEVGIDPDKIYRVTARGREFIDRWLSANALE